MYLRLQEFFSAQKASTATARSALLNTPFALQLSFILRFPSKTNNSRRRRNSNHFRRMRRSSHRRRHSSRFPRRRHCSRRRRSSSRRRRHSHRFRRRRHSSGRRRRSSRVQFPPKNMFDGQLALFGSSLAIMNLRAMITLMLGRVLTRPFQHRAILFRARKMNFPSMTRDLGCQTSTAHSTHRSTTSGGRCNFGIAACAKNSQNL